MPRINLLPWREELRAQRQKNFAVATIAAIALAALVTWSISMFVQGRIDYQSARNDRLDQEIARLDALIEEIAGLERQKERLLARMEIIEQLQRSRPDSVHLFDELVLIVPDSVYFNKVTQVNKRVEISGYAESNARVSALMKNIESSEWLTNPALKVVEAVDGEGARRSQFTITAQQVSLDSEEEES